MGCAPPSWMRSAGYGQPQLALQREPELTDLVSAAFCGVESAKARRNAVTRDDRRSAGILGTTTPNSPQPPRRRKAPGSYPEPGPALGLRSGCRDFIDEAMRSAT